MYMFGLIFSFTGPLLHTCSKMVLLTQDRGTHFHICNKLRQVEGDFPSPKRGIVLYRLEFGDLGLLFKVTPVL